MQYVLEIMIIVINVIYSDVQAIGKSIGTYNTTHIQSYRNTYSQYQDGRWVNQSI